MNDGVGVGEQAEDVNKISEQGQNFLDALKTLSKIDFQKFPKNTNAERYERISKMFSKISPEDRDVCGYEYSLFLDRIGKKIPADIVGEIKTVTGSIIQKNPFESYKTFDALKSYLQSQNEQQNWTESRLHSFLQHISMLGKKLSQEERKILLTILFYTPAFKSCPWSDTNLGLFANTIKFLKGDFKTHVRELFLSLPSIKGIPEINRLGSTWEMILRGNGASIIGGRRPFSNLGGGRWDGVIVRNPV